MTIGGPASARRGDSYVTMRPQPSVGVNVAILAVAALFLVDTFLAWQRACVSFTFIRTTVGGCVSANAWQSQGAAAGVAAGLVCIALILWEGLAVLRMIEAETLATVQRLLVWGLAAAGAAKWLLVIQHFASVGAWIGFGLIFVLAGVDTFAGRS